MKRRLFLLVPMVMILAMMALGSSTAFAAESEPDPEDLAQISYTKLWEGDDFDDNDLEVTFDARIDGMDVVLADGELSQPFHIEGDFELLGENVSGFPDDECSWEQTAMASSTRFIEDDVQHYDATVINTVVCDETDKPDPDDLAEVSYMKMWDGDGFDDSDVEVTFDVRIGDDIVELGNTEVSEPFDKEEDFELLGENVSGFPDDKCSWEQIDVASSGGFVEGQVQRYDVTVINTVDCDEADTVSGRNDEPEAKHEAEDKSEPEQQPEDEAEVKEEAATERPRAEGDVVVSSMLDSSRFGLLALALGGLTFAGSISMLNRLRRQH